MGGYWDIAFGEQMDPEAVVLLNRFTDLTGAKIVISSSWRLAFIHAANALEKLQEYMRLYGLTGEVIDHTGNKEFATRNRIGKEIDAWITNNYQEVDRFVILDDDPDDEMGKLRKYLVKTNSEIGLQEIDLVKMNQILNATEDWHGEDWE